MSIGHTTNNDTNTNTKNIAQHTHAHATQNLVEFFVKGRLQGVEVDEGAPLLGQPTTGILGTDCGPLLLHELIGHVHTTRQQFELGRVREASSRAYSL